MLQTIKEGTFLFILTSSILVLGLFSFWGMIIYILSGTGVCSFIDYVDSFLKSKHGYYDEKKEKIQ